MIHVSGRWAAAPTRDDPAVRRSAARTSARTAARLSGGRARTVSPVPRRALAAVLTACAAVVLALAGPATPAAAHPFGPPPTARISAEGAQVQLVWKASADDWVLLGEALGAFDNPTGDEDFATLTGEQKLQRSRKLHSYLLDRIGVSQRGAPCRGALVVPQHLLDNGVDFTFACPRPVDDVDVRLTALTDLNAAYRTMLSAAHATPARTLVTSDHTTQRLDFATGDATGGAPATALATSGIAAVLAAGGLFALLRRPRRTRKATT
ncbi:MULTISPECIES: hypothetical protein [unclassified Streptomyces]|uniref:hypothetical protein n=1 Tax=unclassified Streptomyces TaxID=2593676 RepID=UPI002E289651|nr:hypothetical protein [Streptomyces sp. NBC_00223]